MLCRACPEQIPPALLPALTPLLSSIQTLSDQIRAIDREIERLAKESYPETQRLTQISGVGPLTALALVLIVEDPGRVDHGENLDELPVERETVPPATVVLELLTVIRDHGHDRLAVRPVLPSAQSWRSNIPRSTSST